MIEKAKHEVFVEGFTDQNKATIDVAHFPDGSPTNRLDPDELREVAEMINQTADELEALLEDD